jgi:CheY-like chemotaxis protein
MTFDDTAPNENFLKTLTVLYVEDEEIVREEVTRFLSRRFARVDSAKKWAGGVRTFSKKQL